MPTLSQEEKEAEKAEVIQAVKALFIPLMLFLSCVILAAGVFLLRNNEPLGWVFIGVTVVVSTASFIALIRFHNGYRARGIMPDKEDIMVEFDDELDAPIHETKPEESANVS